MNTQRYYDDVLAGLIERVNYLERRLSISETIEANSGLSHGVLLGLDQDDHTQYHNDTRGDIRYYTKSQAAAYTGTPSASQFAVWTGAGTLSGTALNTSSFVISQGVLGGQQVAGDTAISGSLHIYGTHYSAGTGNPALTAIYFAPSRGLTPSLSTRMDHDGDWTFTRNVAVQGTLNIEDVTGPAWDHGGLPGLSDDDHTQYFLLAGRGGGQLVYAGTGATDSYSFFASSNASGGGAGVAFDFWAGTDPSDAHLLEMLHNGNARFFNPVGINVAASTDAQLDVVSGAAGRHALRLKAAASPTVDVIDVEDSSGNTIMGLSGAGMLYADFLRGQIQAGVADDSVWDITIPSGINGGVIIIYTANYANGNGVLSWRSGSGPYCNIIAAGANVAASTSVLTGTTGADNRITVSATGGHIYIENRSGSSQTIRAAVFI